MKFAYHIKDRMRKTRYFIYMLMSVWKMLCFMCFMLVVMFFKGENVTQIFSLVNAGFSQHKIQVLEVVYNNNKIINIIVIDTKIIILSTHCSGKSSHAKWNYFTRSCRYSYNWRFGWHRCRICNCDTRTSCTNYFGISLLYIR